MIIYNNWYPLLTTGVPWTRGCLTQKRTGSNLRGSFSRVGSYRSPWRIASRTYTKVRHSKKCIPYLFFINFLQSVLHNLIGKFSSENGFRDDACLWFNTSLESFFLISRITWSTPSLMGSEPSKRRQGVSLYSGWAWKKNIQKITSFLHIKNTSYKKQYRYIRLTEISVIFLSALYKLRIKKSWESGIVHFYSKSLKW